MFHFFLKDILLEIRRQAALAGLVLYLFATTFICYLALGVQGRNLSPATWSTLFWMMILFSAINVGAKSFLGERKGREYYFFSLMPPEEIILSKILYNFLLILLLTFAGAGFFVLLIDNPIQNTQIFVATLVLSSLGFAASLSLLSAIAGKANNSGVLMAILSFPIIISILTLSIRVTKNCIDGLDAAVSVDSLAMIAAIDAIAVALSYILFPFVWRS